MTGSFWVDTSPELEILVIYFQYIHPTDAAKLSQAELVCIDEAAAIPLPLVKGRISDYIYICTLA